jgi:hypothetical protein
MESEVPYTERKNSALGNEGLDGASSAHDFLKKLRICDQQVFTGSEHNFCCFHAAKHGENIFCSNCFRLPIYKSRIRM